MMLGGGRKKVLYGGVGVDVDGGMMVWICKMMMVMKVGGWVVGSEGWWGRGIFVVG